MRRTSSGMARRSTLRGWRHPGARRLRRARHRGQDPGRPLRPREPGALPGPVPRHADRHDRVRAQRPEAGQGPLDGVRPEHAAPGHRHARRADQGDQERRHDAARRAALPVGRGHARRRSSTALSWSTSATAIATSSTTPTASASRRRTLSSAGRRPTASWWRSSSCPSTRSSSAASSIPSSAASRTSRTRSSRASSPPPTQRTHQKPLEPRP